MLGLKLLWVRLQSWVLWPQGCMHTELGAWGVWVLPVNQKRSICRWPQREEGVRAGFLPGEDTLFPFLS